MSHEKWKGAPTPHCLCPTEPIRTSPFDILLSLSTSHEQRSGTGHGYKVQHAGLTHLCYNSTKNGVMQDPGQPCARGRAVYVPWAWLSVQHLHKDASTFLFIHPTTRTPCILQAHPALHQHPVMEPGCCAPWHTSKEEVRAAGQSRGPQKLPAMVMKRGSEGSSTSCPLELSALSQHPEGGWINVRAFPRLFQPALGIGGTSRPTWDKGHHFMVFLTGWGQQLTEPPQSSVNTLLLHQIAQK